MQSKARPTVVEVRRTDRTCTFLWDKAPTAHDRRRAEKGDPPLRRLVGHCWPGDDQTHAPLLLASEEER